MMLFQGLVATAVVLLAVGLLCLTTYWLTCIYHWLRGTPEDQLPPEIRCPKKEPKLREHSSNQRPPFGG